MHKKSKKAQKRSYQMYHNAFLIVEPISSTAKYYCGEVFIGLVERAYTESNTTTIAIWNILKNRRHEIKLSSIGFLEAIKLDPDEIKEPDDLNTAGVIKLNGTRTKLRKFWGQIWIDNKSGGAEILKTVQEHSLLTEAQGKKILATLEEIAEMLAPNLSAEKDGKPLTGEGLREIHL